MKNVCNRPLVLAKVIGLLVPLLLLGAKVNAAPISFSDAGDSGLIELGGNIDGVDVDGLTAELLFELTSTNGGLSFVFDVTVRNTTDGAIWDSARASRIGFDVTPDFASVAVADWFVSSPDPSGSFPNNFGSIDVCIQAQSQGNCQGGPGGVGIGGEAMFELTLNFASAIDAVTLSKFGVRWQSLDSDRLGFDGDSGTGSTTTTVPAPGVLGLLGLGLLGISAVRRRRLG